MANNRVRRALFLALILALLTDFGFPQGFATTEQCVGVTPAKSHSIRVDTPTGVVVSLLIELYEIECDPEGNAKTRARYLAFFDGSIGPPEHHLSRPAARESFDLRTMLFRFLRPSQRLFESHPTIAS